MKFGVGIQNFSFVVDNCGAGTYFTPCRQHAENLDEPDDPVAICRNLWPGRLPATSRCS